MKPCFWFLLRGITTLNVLDDLYANCGLCRFNRGNFKYGDKSLASVVLAFGESRGRRRILSRLTIHRPESPKNAIFVALGQRMSEAYWLNRSRHGKFKREVGSLSAKLNRDRRSRRIGFRLHTLLPRL